jgi:hypothetical protein
LVKGIADNPDNLESRFGIPRRLAVRIAALAGYGVQVTPALLEDVSRKPALAEFLLSDDLFQAAKEGLATLRKTVAGVGDLEFLTGEGGSIIALAEEVIAERVLPPAISGATAPIRRPGETPAQHLPLLNELLLGTPEGDHALRREKIRFLTSADWQERMEALRKILMFDLQPGDKAAVLFFALRDDDHRIISEAVKAFKQMGLSANIADALIEVIRGDETARHQALDWLLHASTKVRRQESDILVAVTARLIRDEAFQDLKAKILKLLRAHLRGRESSPREIREIVRILTRDVPPQQEDAQLTLRDLLLSIGKGNADFLCEALWEELEGIPWGAHRTFLLTLLGRMEMRKAGLERLDRLLTQEEFPKAVERGHDLTVYRYLLKRRYKELFPPLLEMAQKQGEEKRAMIFRGLGESLQDADLKPRAAAHRIKALLAMAERSGKSVRRALLRAKLHLLPNLSMTIRRRFASLFVNTLESEFLPQVNQEVWGAIRGLGWQAFGALSEFVAEDANDPRLRKESLGILKSLLLDAETFPVEGKEINRFLEWIESLLTRPAFSLRNEVAPLLGVALLHPRIAHRQISRIAAGLIRRLRGEYTPGDVGALPFLARSPRIGSELKRKMIRRLLGILDEGENLQIASETTTDQGKLLEIQEGTPVHTQQLPAAILALKEAALNLAAEDQGVAYMIARTFMRKWEDLTRWRRIWGFSSRGGLLKALGEMARSPHVPPPLAAEIFLFLTHQFFENPHELHLAEAVSLPLFEGRFPKAEGIATRVLQLLLEIAQDSESVGPDEAGRFLLSAAHVAASPNAFVRSGKGKATVTHLLDLLEHRINLGFKEDGEALRVLAAASPLQKPMRDRAHALAQIHVPLEEEKEESIEL